MNRKSNNFIDGQPVLEALLSCIESKTVSHAYIFEGPRGIGKKTAAEIFAAALHCTGSPKPCGACRSCAMHRAGTHPDIEVIKPEENGNIKTETIRAAADELYIRPVIAEKKLLIIEGADGLTETAQNALLKTFEEPPAYGVVVLLSENAQRLLPTIRSRGIKLMFRPFAPEKIKTFISSAYPEAREKSEFVAAYSGGIVGRAIEICEDGEFFSLRERMFTELSSLVNGKESIFKTAEVFGFGQKSSAVHRDACFDLTLSWLGDAILLKNGAKITNSDYAEMLGTFCSRVTAKGIMDAFETVSRVKSELNPSMKYDIWIVDMLIKCWRYIHGYSNRS